MSSNQPAAAAAEQCIFAINLQTLFILPINTSVCLYVSVVVVVTCNYLCS